MPTITAVIPVREGSRRLKNKNIAPFAGKNLLTHKIAQLKEVESITRIVVTSDSDHMLHLALEAGAQTHKRAPEYCDEKTKSFGAVVRHIAESVEGEHILWATCTAPLVSPKLYKDAIDSYLKCLDQGFDSLMSVEIFKRYLWSMSGPLNYEPGLKHVPSQELEPLFYITDGILMAPRLKMIEWCYFHGANPFKYVLGKRESVDIDDGLDLVKARAWLDMDETVSHIEPFEL